MAYARYCLALLLAVMWHIPAHAAGVPDARLSVLDKHGTPIVELTDGDLVRLTLRLARPVAAPTTVRFGVDEARRADASCAIASGDTSCTSEAFRALGWYWNGSRQAQPRRVIYAAADDAHIAAMEIGVAPRPVVLVHGFISSPVIWQEYTRPAGFLQSLGLDGYAVGDGQAPGVLRTGDLLQPTAPTNSIAENAAVLADYIAGVKQRTGAEHVDLIAHSMGGLISRYYIDRLMPERDVAQLLMLGTSHGGSPCVQLSASLGWYLPAALELRPAYAAGIFNRQITRRHGVPFYQIAGTSIVDPIKSPCTNVPSDLAVDLDSVSAIETPVVELPELHTDLPNSNAVFSNFVAPHLQTRSGGLEFSPDPPQPPPAQQLQFTELQSGHIPAGDSRELQIDLDQVAVASFGLFDPTRSLTVEVRGARGAVIPLDPDVNGLFTVDDPATLVHLGYGFANPAPGPWRVTLATTPATPPQGAPYTLSTRVVGGATLHAGVDRTVPQLNETVVLTASLELTSRQPAGAEFEASIRAPDGTTERLVFGGEQPRAQTSIIARQPGMYSVDLLAHGSAENDTPVERSAFLAFEVQPAPTFGRRNLGLILTIVSVVLLGVGVRLARAFRRRTN